MTHGQLKLLAAAAMLVASPVLAQGSPDFGAPPVRIVPAPPIRAEVAPAPMLAVDQATLDEGGYRPLAYGARLPRGWMRADHFIAEPGAFGLAAPAPGFGWSRYHDDAVLTDQWGRVYAARAGIDWARPDRRYTRRRSTDGVAGGVGGAAVGAVAGNLIAGSGSRLAGSLIGGGVGALVGMGVELLTRHDRGRAVAPVETGYAAHWNDAGYDEGLACDCDAGDAFEDEVRTVTTTYPGERVCTPRASFAAAPQRARPSKYLRQQTVARATR